MTSAYAYSVAVPGCIYTTDGYALVEDDAWPVSLRTTDHAIVLVLASGLNEKPEYSYVVTTSRKGETVVGWMKTEELLLIEGVRYF